jgi:hypothetical protein
MSLEGGVVTAAAAAAAAGEFYDQADAKWIVIRGSLGVIMIRPTGDQTPAGLQAALSAARELAALRAH